MTTLNRRNIPNRNIPKYRGAFSGMLLHPSCSTFPGSNKFQYKDFKDCCVSLKVCSSSFPQVPSVVTVMTWLIPMPKANK